uniref:1-acyl-sn-glycerol-3-phosphate acyltransferase n=1 Tax=Callorhinchus milii TaxID=7868 RepID=A0A4W3JUP0_CALMI
RAAAAGGGRREARGSRRQVGPESLGLGLRLRPKAMAVWLLLLLLLLIPVLCQLSATFKYYFKMAFYTPSMALALGVIPPLPSAGRNLGNLRIVRYVLQHIKYLYGIKLQVNGMENLQVKGPFVVISNHQSSLDLMGMMEILPDRCVAIAKKELMYAGTVGLVCWLTGIVFINRQKKSDAKSVMSEAAQTMLKEDVRLWVFPEGTRNHDGKMLPFKRGAFHLAVQAQVPIIPVVFSSYNDFYNKKEKRFDSGTYTVQILQRIETKGLTADDVPDLTEMAQKTMVIAWHEISAAMLKGSENQS